MTNITWQLGEFKALMTLGGRSQKIAKTPYAGKEEMVAYGDHEQQVILVYPPYPGVQPRKTAIYFIHGGGWSMGNPSQYRFVGRFFAKLGYPTILAGYRLVPEFIFPTQIEDVASGLTTGLATLKKFGVSVSQIVMGGHSAGANLTSLLCYDRNYAKKERSMFKGIFPMSGSINLSACQNPGMQKLLRPYIGHLPSPDIADPFHHATPELPVSVLCIHGAKDPLCQVENSISFTAKLNKGSIQRAHCHIIPHLYHSDTLYLFMDSTPDTKVLLDWLNDIDKG